MTTPEGIFDFRALPFGAYTLEAVQTNFKRKVITHITLQVAQTQSLEVVLQIGDAAESISVNASTGLLQTSEASLPRRLTKKGFWSFR